MCAAFRLAAASCQGAVDKGCGGQEWPVTMTGMGGRDKPEYAIAVRNPARVCGGSVG